MQVLYFFMPKGGKDMAEKKPEVKKIRVFTAKDGAELELMSIVLASNKVLYTVKPLKTGAYRLTTLAEIPDSKRVKLVNAIEEARTLQ